MPAIVEQDKCTACASCEGACPVEAITMEEDTAKVADSCIDCGACVDECPLEAISMN